MYRLPRWRRSVRSATVGLLATACGRLGTGPDIVARAGGHELAVESAARILAQNPKLVADTAMVQALADVWVDYALLSAAAAEDPTLERLDLDVLVTPTREQAIIKKLRAQVVHADTTFTEDEERARRLAAGMLGAEKPEGAPGEREREREGERAREQARDRDRARRAARGESLGPMDADALAEAKQEEFHHMLVETAQMDAEGVYLDSIAKAANVVMTPSGLATLRAVAARPGEAGARTDERVIATYRSGALTAAEVVRFVRTQPAPMQRALALLPDDQLTSVARQLVQKELLLAIAERSRVTLTPSEDAAILGAARQDVERVRQAAGIPPRPAGGAPASGAGASIDDLLRDAMTRRGQLVSLDRLGIALRSRYPNEIDVRSFGRVMRKVAELRGAAPVAPPSGAHGT